MDKHTQFAADLGPVAAPLVINADTVSQALPPRDALETVAEVLGAYASRGVFQDYRMVKRKADIAEFHFGWLYNQPFTLTCDLKRKRLSLPDLLPRIEKNSLMYKELKAFLKARSDPGLPDHRRVDSQLATVESRLRGGLVSIELSLLGDDYELGTRKLVNVVHELFLFMNEYWADYMWENFRLNME